MSHHLLAMIQAAPPLAKFSVAMALIVVVPSLSRRIRLPAVAGLLLSGVVIGPHVLGLIPENHPIAAFISDLGKLLLMFFAGLEIDLEMFRKSRNRSIAFGLLTCAIPEVLGTIVVLGFGYGFDTALVFGSLLGSHTLLGFPTVERLGETHLESITVTIGGTIIATIISLLVFAIGIPIHENGFLASAFALQLVEIALFIPILLVGLRRFAAYALDKVKDDEDAYFILMLIIVSAAAVASQMVQLPGIVGAFLAGLAVNSAVRGHPATEKLQFFGNAFFIPSFFIVIGFLIDPVLFVQSIIDNRALVLAILICLIGGKWLAAEIIGYACGYNRDVRITIWSLTLPQVAATLAPALVAYNDVNHTGQRLFDVHIFDAVLVLVLVTSILGPLLTETFAPRLRIELTDHSFKTGTGS